MYSQSTNLNHKSSLSCGCDAMAHSDSRSTSSIVDTVLLWYTDVEIAPFIFGNRKHVTNLAGISADNYTQTTIDQYFS